MPLGLRTATPEGDWRSFKFEVTDTNGHDHFDIVLVNETVGVVFIAEIQYDDHGCATDRSVDAGDEAVLIYHAEKIEVCKVQGSGTAFNPGDKVYWSGTNGDCVTPNHASGLYWIGICTDAATDDDEFVIIDLKGDKATLLE